MSRPLHIPSPQTPLHLYRQLLREASYLPPIARPYIDKQIKTGFRKHQKHDAKDAQRMRQGKHDLRVLRAANLGDLVRMRRVLLRAFGRMGRRRRELMADLLKKPPPTNTEELAKLAANVSSISSGDRDADWLDAWDTEKLRALAKSQMAAGLINTPKPPITVSNIKPEQAVPAENSWGRPLHPKPARTKLKNAWKLVADKCMPPLPREEWQALGDIVEGVVKGRWLPPPRRPLAQPLAPQEPMRRWDWEAYAVKPVAAVDRPANRRNKLLTGAVDDNTPTGDPEPINCHRYTPRLWRRLLGGIWQLTPVMEPHPAGKGWSIAWGKPKFEPAKATKGALEFFSSLPEPAEPPKGGRKRKQS
ncbi:hypothetical protein VTJ83DRAFT_5224 [Remersonia thermophila]|uniref:LYR motif-containing protein Cup1-like N-terminal domain-containing protein n=1 Tax=Remersonia thermophila TaxID=72144 RepID=A0ABR4DEE6_9PEZI